jgi:hypothetical protein
MTFLDPTLDKCAVVKPFSIPQRRSNEVLLTCAGDLFLVIYSIDSRESFDEARRLQEQVYQAKAGQQGQLLGVSNAAGGGGVGNVHRPLVSAIRQSKLERAPRADGDRR